MRLGHAERSGQRRSRAGAAGLVLCLTAAIFVLTAAPAAAEVAFTFEGGGYGHSVGMSQYGAYGMALEGYTWEQVLSHYFTGASPADADPALAAAPSGSASPRSAPGWSGPWSPAAPTPLTPSPSPGWRLDHRSGG